MRRIAVIGATGHVGTYLVPRLVRAGHQVIALSRGEQEPYTAAPEWDVVETLRFDRGADDAYEQVAALNADVVIDMICFNGESARRMVEALRPRQPLLLHCGTIWVHGPAARVPITEDEPRTAYGEYGKGKLQAESYLLRQREVPTVILHPGHISGPGWPVITPAGNLDPRVWRTLADGDPLPLPDLGLGVLHHVHADDVAQAFEKAITRPAAIGGSFHVVAEQAMTTRGLADGAAAWWSKRAMIQNVGWDEYERRVGAEHAQATREHVGRSITASIDRAKRVLDYAPRYSSLQALKEAVQWLSAHGKLT